MNAHLDKDIEFLQSEIGETLHGVSSSRIINAKIPEDFRMINFKTLTNANVLEPLAQVNEYLSHLGTAYKNGTGLYLFGNGKGTGKTSLMCHALIQTQKYEPHLPAMFSTYQDFLDVARLKYDEDSRAELKKFYDVKFLGLDEVYAGAEGSKEDLECINAITRLIKDRSNNRVPTFITSNYTPKQFRDAYGERADSVLEGSKYLHIEFKGSDIRKA